ncbi:MAG TPA: hypothetical protein VGF36_17740 [Rhodopila sp.]
MSFAINDDVRFTAGRSEETWVPGTGTFTGLDDADQQVLSDWLDQAGARGIDAALDFSVRPWGVTGTGAIVGVFEAGEHHASWLLVRRGSGWVLARRRDGFVSDEMSSLPAVLALIDANWGC